MKQFSEKISGKTKITGIIGYPVEHSMSPPMQNACFQSIGLDYIYAPFEVEPDKLAEAIEGIKALGFKGINVTIPHKEKVREFLDELSQEARLIGAVNTIVNEKGVLKGYNTDGAGFVRSLQDEKVEVKGSNVIILGSGGAARAVSIQLALAGAKKVYVMARDIKKAKAITDLIETETPAEAEARTFDGDKNIYAKDSNIVINCTPIGMHPNINEAPEFDLSKVPQGSVVTDLIYNPAETLFLQKARRLGHKTLSGKGMLLFQGALAFELWTGKPADIEVMKEALNKQLNKSYV